MKLVYYKMITKIFMSILNNIIFHHVIIRNAIDEIIQKFCLFMAINLWNQINR